MMKRLYWPVEQCEQNYKGEEVGRGARLSLIHI